MVSYYLMASHVPLLLTFGHNMLTLKLQKPITRASLLRGKKRKHNRHDEVINHFLFLDIQ